MCDKNRVSFEAKIFYAILPECAADLDSGVAEIVGASDDVVSDFVDLREAGCRPEFH